MKIVSISKHLSHISVLASKTEIRGVSMEKKIAILYVSIKEYQKYISCGKILHHTVGPVQDSSNINGKHHERTKMGMQHATPLVRIKSDGEEKMGRKETRSRPLRKGDKEREEEELERKGRVGQRRK